MAQKQFYRSALAKSERDALFPPPTGLEGRINGMARDALGLLWSALPGFRGRMAGASVSLVALTPSGDLLDFAQLVETHRGNRPRLLIRYFRPESTSMPSSWAGTRLRRTGGKVYCSGRSAAELAEAAIAHYNDLVRREEADIEFFGAPDAVASFRQAIREFRRWPAEAGQQIPTSERGPFLEEAAHVNGAD